MSKAIFKFNNGNGALLCNACSTIIKVGFQYTELESKASRGEITLEAQYCSHKCKYPHCKQIEECSKSLTGKCICPKN